MAEESETEGMYIRARGSRDANSISISRPLTIERVRRVVCTQGYIHEKRSSRGMQEKTCSPRLLPLPSRLVLSAISPWKRRKGFSITFCRCFCSALFAFEPTSRGGFPFGIARKKLSPLTHPFPPDALFNHRFRVSLSGESRATYFPDFSYYASSRLGLRAKLHSCEIHSGS